MLYGAGCFKGCFAPASAVKGSVHRAFSPICCPTAMPCWWGPTRPKHLSMAATARVIWLCACVRYWPYRGLVLSVSLAVIIVIWDILVMQLYRVVYREIPHESLVFSTILGEMGRLGVIQWNRTDRWEGSVEYWRIDNGFPAFWSAVFFMAWYKVLYLFESES